MTYDEYIKQHESSPAVREIRQKKMDSHSGKLWNKKTLSKFRKETGSSFSKALKSHK